MNSTKQTGLTDLSFGFDDSASQLNAQEGNSLTGQQETQGSPKLDPGQAIVACLLISKCQGTDDLFGDLFGIGPLLGLGGVKGSDPFDDLVNSSQFEKKIRRGKEFTNKGSAKNAFSKLRQNLGVSQAAIKRQSNGTLTFQSGNRTFSLRSDSLNGNTISRQTKGIKAQTKIRFGSP